MSQLTFNAPFNALSFGQVTYNIAKELFKRKIDVNLIPTGKVNVSAFKPEPDFLAWLNEAEAKGLKDFKHTDPCLKLWHIQGSENRISSKRHVLFTFHETDQPTDEEVNIINQQDFTFFSSSYSKDNFAFRGATNIDNVGLGFDPEIQIDGGKRKLPPSITHWILVGKWEKRKNTAMIIKTWVDKYANNPAHSLTLLVFNPFLHQADQQAHERNFNVAFGGKPKPYNVQIHNPYVTNFEVNDLYNSADIDLSGFSNAEGWGLPAFNTTALGKATIVTNCSAHSDWATKDNCILIEPIGKQPVYDGVHFAQNLKYNQGNIFLFTEEQLSKAMDVAYKTYKNGNPEGVKLRETFTYAKTVDKLLEKTL